MYISVIRGTATFVPIGKLKIHLFEQTDTGALSYKTPYLSVYNDNYYLSGSTSINLKN